MARFGVLCCAVVLAVQLVSSLPVIPRADEVEDAKNALLMQREDLFQGDIAGIDMDNRNGILSPTKRWTNQKVPYVIDPKFTASQRAVVEVAIAQINNSTNVLLVLRTTETSYIFIQAGAVNTGCYSYVGRVGGRQIVNLQVPVPGYGTCITVGIAVHEITHAIGFYHEQSRTDRDNHVEINWNNINPNQRHNFNNYDEKTITHFGQPYDYDSVMHYGKYDFAIDRNVWTIRGKEPYEDTPIGQRRGLSPIDIAKMNAMYPIPKNPTTVAPTVQTDAPEPTN
ncbi:hypothetical protein RvY_10349 [Ramazzottius varieornatus]|uniref:Metalloendopeptidase n=1 Tax=Ramazzottius varieornatus TaxID=947166 RepID=A0A1D1VLH8_RAMVA|nr:hypothetical protein RvY_10349 [Ramazzottius varieornatus]